MGSMGWPLLGRQLALARGRRRCPHLQHHPPELAGNSGPGRRGRGRRVGWRVGCRAAAWGFGPPGHAVHAACLPLIRGDGAAAWCMPR
eukprot:scaffold319431_cov18-Tisochrysis_lutea.AAC.1